MLRRALLGGASAAALLSHAQARLFRPSGGAVVSGGGGGAGLATVSTAAYINGQTFTTGGGTANTLLATLQGISNGSMQLTIDGTLVTLSGMNFTGAGDWIACAAVITAALGAHGSSQWMSFGTPLGSSAFIIQSATYGSGSSITYASATGSGTDISATCGFTSGTAVSLTNGAAVVFDETTGTSLGAYTDPSTAWSSGSRFTQSCTLVSQTVQGQVMNVMFRRDTASTTGTLGRLEVIYETGVFPTVLSTPHHVGPYTAAVTDGGVATYSTTVPWHTYWGRWRQTPGERPVNVTPATLIGLNLLPNYNSSVNNSGSTPATPPVAIYSPMQCTLNSNGTGIGYNYVGGMVLAQGQTGDRPEIGPVSDWCADYILNGTSLSSVFATAEAVGFWGFAIRDSSIGSGNLPPANMVQTYTTASPLGGGSPLLVWPQFPGTAENDTGHSPMVHYLPWMLTGDPYFLENMQFQANSDLLVGVGDRYHSDGGPRYFAWPMRNMMVCTFTCPNATQLGPCKWLQPQSVWTAGLVNYVAWADTNLTNATDGLHTTFHNPALTGGQQIVPPQASGTWIDFWQTGYFGITLGWAMKMGAASVDSRFTAFYAWQVQSIMARTTSGSHPPLSFTGTISGNTLTALTYLNGISLHNFTNVGVGSSISAIFTAAGLPGSPITVTAAGSGGSSVNSQVSALVSDINANSTLAAFGISAVVGTTWGGGDFYVPITLAILCGVWMCN